MCVYKFQTNIKYKLIEQKRTVANSKFEFSDGRVAPASLPLSGKQTVEDTVSDVNLKFVNTHEHSSHKM